MAGVPGMVVTPAGIEARRLGRWGIESTEARLRRRFWEKVDRSGGPNACWLWCGTRHTDKLPYGAIRVGPRMLYAHRIALEFSLGRPLRDVMLALHTCDNPPCVNPNHLYEGTASDNQYDRARRRPPARRSHCAKGHPFAPPHLEIRANGRRLCRTCTNATRRRRYVALHVAARLQVLGANYTNPEPEGSAA